MRINKSVLDYLKGIDFNNGAKIELENRLVFMSRDDYLVNLSKNKVVIHLGFVDHLPLVEKKIEEGLWLHKKIIESSNLCFGIDVNIEGVNYLKGAYGLSNLYSIDLIKDELPEEIIKEKIDYLLIPDVIEHIGDPVAFLKAIKNKLVNVDRIVLTVPNAFRLNNFIFSFRNIECINTDHRFWFTPYTLSKIVTDAGFDIVELGFCEHGYLGASKILRKIFLSKYFSFRDTLVIEIKNKL